MKSKKIYIIGPVGSGKTTLAKKLAVKYHIQNYELDSIVWNDQFGYKRSCEEISQLFQEILNEDSFIIEDVGREIFRDGRISADVVYYIKLSKIRLYFRVIKRWTKQKFSLEKCSYKPTLKMLFQMFIWLHQDLKNREKKVQEIQKDQKHFILLNYKDFCKLTK